MVIVLNLKHLSVTKGFPCHCNSVKCFCVLQPEIDILGPGCSGVPDIILKSETMKKSCVLTYVCTLLYHVSRHAQDVQVHHEIYQAVSLNDKCRIKD